MELKENVRDRAQCKPKIVADKAAMMAIDADRYNFMPAARRNKRKASRDEEDIGSFSLCVDSSTEHGEIVEQSVTQKQVTTSGGKILVSAIRKSRVLCLRKRKPRKRATSVNFLMIQYLRQSPCHAVILHRSYA